MTTRAKSSMGGKKSSAKSGGKKPHSIHIKRGHSGGFVATHHHQPDETGAAMPSEEHVVPDLSSLQDHIASNMGDQGPAPMSPPPDAGSGQAPPQGM